jgi:putative transcriptional regulator
MSRILDAIHETARDLRKAGVMGEVTMRKFNALCLPPVKRYTAAEIRRMRAKLRVSQAVFAAYMNVGKTTVQQWEQGQKKPNGPSLKLLDLVDRKGLKVLA